MDFSKDNLSLADTSVPGGAAIDKIASGLASGIRTSAKTKLAKKVSDSGQYWTLTPYQKSLIQIPQYILEQVKNQGITYYAVYQLPNQSVGSNNTQIITQLKTLSVGGVAPGVSGPAATAAAQNVIGEAASSVPVGDMKVQTATTGTDIKKYIPYAIGVVVIGLLIYFIVKHKK
jgi:hypothetical protein